MRAHVARADQAAGARPIGPRSFGEHGYTISPAPDREPPFDDEIPARHLSLVGPLDRPLPFGAAGRPASEDSDTERADPESPRQNAPDHEAFARRLVVAVIEVATGRRSPGQLALHTSAGVHAGLVRDAGRLSRLGTSQRPGRVHSVHSARPASGVAEIAIVVRIDARFRAIAMRLELKDGRWRCVRLNIG